MSLLDSFDKAESSVSKYQLEGEKRTYIVYEIKISASLKIMKGRMNYIVEDSKNKNKFIIIFNSQFFSPKATTVMKLSKFFKNYTDLLFNKNLFRFVIKVKSFVAQRRLIEMFDRIFDENNISRNKYNYFSDKQQNKMIDWLLR